ncbi:MAG: tetratricopeptide repeat protein [Planctomycetota bacterium]
MMPQDQQIEPTKFHHLCDEFRTAWRDANDSVESFLQRQKLSSSDESQQLLVHLLQCEIDLRRQTGQTIDRGEFEQRFPDLSPDVLDNLLSMPGLPPTGSVTRPRKPQMPERYQVANQLGRGGIGSVWRVEDSLMQRTLAVKVLHDKFKFSHAANMRLQREALLAGALQHPGIPPVFETGELVNGSRFFTMKLVEGQTLDELLQQRKDVSENRQYLLGVFRQIADAVGYAHSKAVIHRDLKPQNVMVGAFGEVQIMDWGMAKRLGEESEIQSPQPDPQSNQQERPAQSANETFSLSIDSSIVEENSRDDLTMQGDVVGTPMYMSPEQAQGDLENLNERSDVFSLGSILFEILTAERLYQTSGTDLLDAAANGDVESTLARLGDIEKDPALIAICQSCLQRQPANRPQNGQAIASAIAQYLDSVDQRLRDVELEKKSTEVRLQEETKRRQQAFWLTGAIVSAILMGMAGILWQWNRAAINAQEASEAARESKTSATRSSDVLMIVTDAFRSVDPSEGADSTMTAKQVLLNARASLEDSSLDDQGRMILLSNLASCFRELGEYELAMTSYEESLELHRKLLGNDHLDTLVTMNELAVVYLDLGRIKKAYPMQKETLELHQDVLGIDHEETLVAMNNLALVHEKAGRYEEALTLYESLFQLHDNRKDAEAHPDQRTWLSNLSNVYYYLGRSDDALEVDEQLLELQKNELGESHQSTLQAMNNISMRYRALGRLDDALAMARRTLELIKVKYGESHPITAIVMGNVAFVLEAKGDFQEAVDLNRKTLKLKQEKYGVDHPETMITMNNLATTLRAIDELDEALEVNLEAFDLLKAKLGPSHKTTLMSMQNLATVYSELGKDEEALQLEIENLKLRKEALGEDHPDTLMSMNNLAEVYNSLGRFDEALNLFEETLKLKQTKLGEKHAETAATMNNLASTYADVGRLEDSLKMHQQAYAIFKEINGESHPRTLMSAGNLALALDRLERFDEAIELYQATLKGKQKEYGIDHRETATTMIDLAGCLQSNGELSKAMSMLEKAQTSLIDSLGNDHPLTWRTNQDLAYAYEQNEELEKAKDLLETTLESQQKERPKHWTTFETQSQLGGVLTTLDQTKKAESLLINGYEGLEAASSKMSETIRQTRLRLALKRLVNHYEKMKSTDEAAKWNALLNGL